MSSTESRITNLERRIEELKKKQQQSSATSKDRNETTAAEAKLQRPKTPLTSHQKGWLYAFTALTVISVLSLVKTSMPDLHWSILLEALITVYRAVFHVPVDWLFALLSAAPFSEALGWTEAAIPSCVKDTFVMVLCSIFSINLLTIRDLGKNYWTVLSSEVEKYVQDTTSPIVLMFCRIVIFIYTILFMVFAPFALLFGYRWFRYKGETDSWEPFMSLADAYIRFLLLILLLTGAALVVNGAINAVLEYLGL